MNELQNISYTSFPIALGDADRDLLSKAKPFLDLVTRTMGAADLGRFFFFDFHPHPNGMAIDHENRIYIGVDFAEALLKKNDAYSISEVMGVLAHEIGHRISKDWEEEHKKILESIGCHVESLQDISELDKLITFESMGYRFPKTESAKRLYEDFIKYGLKEHTKKENGIEDFYLPTFYDSMMYLMDQSGGHSYDPQIDDYEEENYKRALESIGCKIESWEDITEFRNAFWKDCKILPEKESVKHLCLAFLNYHSKYSDEKIKNQIIRRINWKQLWLNLWNDFKKNHPAWFRDSERRADLHTMRNPALARGLRDYFLGRVENCRTKALLNREDCLDVEKDGLTHPSLTNRLTYMTKALCKNYPEDNRDICPNARLPHNATCPSFSSLYTTMINTKPRN